MPEIKDKILEGDMHIVTNEEWLGAAPIEILPESWRIQWKHWLDDLDSDKITTADIRKLLFQMKDRK